jgi:hypothetical protein
MILSEKFLDKKLELEILDQLDQDLQDPVETKPIPLLDRLPLEKRIVPIVIDIEIDNETLFRDEFDWDLNLK